MFPLVHKYLIQLYSVCEAVKRSSTPPWRQERLLNPPEYTGGGGGRGAEATPREITPPEVGGGGK
jgi:hypothetical protein